MDSETCDRLRRLSCELTGNNVLLPVAAGMAELAEEGVVSAPAVTRQLRGRLPANRVVVALRRLDRLGER